MNFCMPCLEPSIAVNKPEADGREVGNLISEDLKLKHCGYMGEYFIRPPVDITLTFKVPIDISHIKLSANLERKSSTGFSVFTQPEKGDQTKEVNSINSRSETESNSLPTNDCNVFLKDSCATSSDQSTQESLGQNDTSDVYFCVGTFFTKGEDIVILKNHYYKHWIKLKFPNDDDDRVTEKGLKLYRGSMKHTNRLALRCVKRIIIRILKTTGSVPPVLRFLEVWGQPGISTGKALRKEVLTSWQKRTQSVEAAPVIPRIYNSLPEDKKQDACVEDNSKSKDSFEIPEDFLDPLTCDIMTVPLLLPSGHSIDADTLDRFIANEAVWGRPASDPFTGIPFKPGQMPSPNVPLKARIDRFLLLNADQPGIQACHRTLPLSGRTQGTGGFQMVISSARTDNLNCGAKRKRESSDDALENRNMCLDTDNRDAQTKLTKTKFHVKGATVSNNETGSKSISDASKDKVPYASKPKDLLDGINSFRGSTLQKLTDTGKLNQSGGSAKNHFGKPMIKSSTKSSSVHHGMIHMISSALSQTQQRPSSSRYEGSVSKPSSLIHGDAKPKDVSALDLATKNSNACQCGEKSLLYSLPCQHLICRKCLLLHQSVGVIQCLLCQKQSKTSEVIKYHEKSIFSMD